jgi:hypothetical protein
VLFCAGICFAAVLEVSFCFEVAFAFFKAVIPAEGRIFGPMRDRLQSHWNWKLN